MEKILIGGIFSFIVTFYAIPVIISVAEMKKLYDVPDERKIHSNPIPSLGGLGMFAGFIISILLTTVFSNNAQEFQYYVAAALIIFFLGIKDDIMVLSPWKKFVGQLIVATILIFKANILISSMHGFLGIHQLEGTSSYLLTYFAIIVIINAFNLIDGVDGLAGSVGFVSALVFSAIFFMNGLIAYSILAFTLAGSILGFLIYNYHPAKIFMGDTGSMLLGLVNAILVLKFIEFAPSYTKIPIQSAPAVGFGILLMPLLDTLRVFAIRIFNRRSPFSPDRNHLHHLLLDCGFSHLAVTLTIAGASIFFSVFAFLTQSWGTTVMIGSMISLFFIGIYCIYLAKPKPILRVVKIDENIEETSVTVKPANIKRLSFFSTKVREEERVN
jgi:UDP-GlcNAc:undecaprenyl-phosphate/decaprenyl-phosphate GlcNAc-1-phosphate transferase